MLVVLVMLDTILWETIRTGNYFNFLIDCVKING